MRTALCITAAALAVAACDMPTDGGNAQSPGGIAFEILSVDWVTDEFGVEYATGRIRNNASVTYDYVQVEINLYDDSDTLVGSTLDNVTNLGPDEIWEFRAVILEESATRFEVKDITGQ